MSNALIVLTDFCDSKSISIAPTKTFHVQFGPSNFEAVYNIGDVVIARKDIVRDLGFYIKNDCSIDEHVNIITANANKRYYSIFKKVITSDEQILIKIFNCYVRPLLEYGSPLFNIQKECTVKQLEECQRIFTRLIYMRNNRRTYDMPDYSERLKIYEMDSLHQRRMVADVVMAYDTLVSHPNPEIDLYFHPLQHRSNGTYLSKFTAKGKYCATHFSTRAASLLNNLNIILKNYETSEHLRIYLNSIDLTDKKLFMYKN
jgi:hypothetical protein